MLLLRGFLRERESLTGYTGGENGSPVCNPADKSELIRGDCAQSHVGFSIFVFLISLGG